MTRDKTVIFIIVWIVLSLIAYIVIFNLVFMKADFWTGFLEEVNDPHVYFECEYESGERLFYRGIDAPGCQADVFYLGGEVVMDEPEGEESCKAISGYAFYDAINADREYMNSISNEGCLDK